ncbi:hypothetical protein PoB_002315000 [Plakobranchus ocellatus]|uniref:Uncharacterized protein n=1 Tax=Plakobranchus ocellatus TaxID=259542 RepID=A0AAV3ZNC7_9GAST|nr:hypothetical protein PoB_002315000 [Plakobranchus ocellatus]
MAHMDLDVSTSAAISVLSLQTFVTALMAIVTWDASQGTKHHYALKNVPEEDMVLAVHSPAVTTVQGRAIPVIM